MHPYHWAKVSPQRTAIIMAGSGQRISYGELDAASNKVAHLLRGLGLERGDGIALFMQNNIHFLEICWGAQRSGLYFTPISWRSKLDELVYILRNSGARALFADEQYATLASDAAREAGIKSVFVLGDAAVEGQSYRDALVAQPASAIADESPGRDMLYSSGTTGRPKGVKIALPDSDLTTIQPAMAWLTSRYGFDENTVNLTPAPLYHAGPLRYSMCLGHTGGTNIIMEKFDAEHALQLIEKYRVTHTEMVPTMFVRLTKLPQSVRDKYDLSSLKMMVHGTGPCAREIKQAMIDWLGPILEEQYGGTEGNGLCAIDSHEWLERPGSVGRAVIGAVRIVDENGNELPAGREGLVYFEGGPRFEYHDEPAKTSQAYSAQGWSTLGDIGYLDEDGYLYLTDRQSDMIISGGMNIYPREVENVLINHDKVMDVAVFGVPHPEFGEAVKAVVQLSPGTEISGELEKELLEYCRERISSIKCPRSIDFADELPRHETGKIYKRLLKARYAAQP
ncbi:MAG: acyl-CoA synthetase [Porticoccaceae bacterium]